MNDILAAIRPIGPAFRAWAVPFCAVAGFLLSASIALRDLFDRRPRLRVRAFTAATPGKPAVVSVEVVNVGRVAVAVRRVGLFFADGSVGGDLSGTDSTRVVMPCRLAPGDSIVQAFFLNFPEIHPRVAVVPAAETCAGKVFRALRARSFDAMLGDRRAVNARIRRRRRDCFSLWTRLRVKAAVQTVGKPAKEDSKKEQGVEEVK